MTTWTLVVFVTGITLSDSTKMVVVPGFHSTMECLRKVEEIDRPKLNINALCLRRAKPKMFPYIQDLTYKHEPWE